MRTCHEQQQAESRDRGQPAQRPRSSGPATPDDRARSARNTLKHGLPASTIAVLNN
jgi:hypothetical protein